MKNTWRGTAVKVSISFAVVSIFILAALHFLPLETFTKGYGLTAVLAITNFCSMTRNNWMYFNYCIRDFFGFHGREISTPWLE